MAALILTQAQCQLMQAQVARLAPEEACGLIAGKGRYASLVLPVTNCLHSQFRFRMDPAEQVAAFRQIEQRGLDLLAIYHSHPAGPRIPSVTDTAEHNYPEVMALIWCFQPEAGWSSRAFQIQDRQAVERELQMIA